MMSQREIILKYIDDKYGAKPDYLWKKHPNDAVLRHDKKGKWFALVMKIKKEKLGIKGDSTTHILNLKIQPEFIGTLRLSKGFLPAYHMNKEHWVSILLDNTVAIEEIESLIDTSYELTKK